MGERRTERNQGDGSADKPTTSRRRVSVPEAANVLGLTVEAIRGRIKRNTIAYERDGERVFVLVDADKPTTSYDQSNDQPPDESDHARELVEEMRDRIDDLRRRLDQSEEARRRADTIIMQLTQTNATLAARVPELEAAPPQGPTGAPESATVGAESADTSTDHVTPKTPTPEKLPEQPRKGILARLMGW